MTPVFLDFETFWSATHSLTKMNPIEYVMSDETEIISCAIKQGGNETRVFVGQDEIHMALSSIDWGNSMAIAHNMSGFDAMILAWRFGISPKAWGCTLAMSRPLHQKSVGGSLKALVEHYSLGVKDNTVLMNTKGRHLKDFTSDEIAAMRVYNKADTDQCAMLFNIFKPQTSAKEMWLIDATIRMLVEPQFDVDEALLRKTLKDEGARKQQMLVDLATMTGAYEPGMTDEDAAEAVCKTLGSAAKFGALLRDLEVDVPMKVSPTTGKPAPALAKTDEAFIALTKHEDPVVAAAANARLGVKSTLLETRIDQFLKASEATGGKLPIPLTYYGAHTGRWSGWGYNPQNLPRISGKPSDALRNSLKAPPGYKIVVSDLSGIELRVNHFLWQVPYSTKLWTADPTADLYRAAGAEWYGKPMDEITKDERHLEKIKQLGLGFSAGGITFKKIAKLMGGIILTDNGAVEAVVAYREKHQEIVQGWRRCDRSLGFINEESEVEIDPWGLCKTVSGGILLPSGRSILYPKLRRTTHDGKAVWKCGEGRNEIFLSGGKVDENIVQAIARDVISDQMIEIFKRTGLRPALIVHDEVCMIVREHNADSVLNTMNDVMRTPPKWWPELKLWSEGSIGATYGEAK